MPQHLSNTYADLQKGQPVPDKDGTGEHIATVGADIRALRKGRGLTLEALADDLGKSVGFLSQVERGISTPSLSDLRQLARLFEIPLSFFLAPQSSAPEEAGFIQRAQDRRMIGDEGGLIEELLSPDLSGSFEMLRSTFAPHSQSQGFISRPTEESGFILKGQFDLWLNGQWHHLKAGDSFRFKEAKMKWANPYDSECVIIWVIAPPVY
ncbi:MAG: helix-turn-helix domain-containing protein [Candidatus Puniceispirillaceae bacterium]